jgi:long-subunit fatty acid transport protein
MEIPVRRSIFALLVTAVIGWPAFAQNTDIESLAGVQFNFGNPGARSLGMGGAFLALADDASSVEANPAGLTILRKPEIALELRNFQEQQIFSTSGTFPDVGRTAFTHYSHRAEVTFASGVYPLKRVTMAAYYHQPLRNQGAGQVIPQRSPFTGAIEEDVPHFFAGKGGEVLDATQCEALRKIDPLACVEWRVIPFVSALKIQERTVGIAGATQIGNVSFGVTARIQHFTEEAFTIRFQTVDSQIVGINSFAVQATSDIRNRKDHAKDKRDITFGGGLKWAMNDRVSVGAAYKQGATFPTATFAANDSTNFEFVKTADTTFHVPDVFGVGVSVRPIPVLTIEADAVRVTYSNLVDRFFSVNQSVREIDKAYRASDVTEIHAGGEYFFATKVPVAIRAGWWRDPAHSIEYHGPLTSLDRIGAAILFPKGTTRNHLSVGAGLSWAHFQLDGAYEKSPNFSVASLSAVTRF